jgi:hypothetical protein
VSGPRRGGERRGLGRRRSGPGGQRGLRWGQAPCRRRQRGQSLTEFAVILPIFFFLLIAPIELGFMYMHHVGLEYATRAGARVGALLASGKSNSLTWPSVCPTIDAQIIASVERTLVDVGSLVDLDHVNSIQIYKSTASGTPTAGKINTWTYTGPDSGPLVEGQQLSFTGPVTPAWNACTRVNGITPDAIGVAISYSYQLASPLDRMYGVFGSDTVAMNDRTVMVLNP